MDSSSNIGSVRLGAELASIAASERDGRSALNRPEADVSKKFEAMFATMLVKEMRRSLPEGFFGKGTDGDIYGGWLEQTLGDAIAASGALRLSEKVRTALDAKAQDLGAAGASVAAPADARACTTDAAELAASTTAGRRRDAHTLDAHALADHEVHTRAPRAAEGTR